MDISMLSIVQGTTKKPVSAKKLINFFSAHKEYDGILYIGFPIIGTPEGPFSFDAVYISKEQGLVIFNLVEHNSINGYAELQDDAYNKLDSKLRTNKKLMQGRELQVLISVITFAPIYIGGEASQGYPLCNEANLKTQLNQLNWNTPEYSELLISVIQSISTIRNSRKKRTPTKQDSRGTKLKSLEESIANLDRTQSRSVIETVEGVQRIRGLAGSGKTIVLALKAAYLHTQHPEWKIAITFNTRSLKSQFRRLINTFVIEQTNEEPDWDKIQIIHAWGAQGGIEKNGIYFNFCKENNLKYLDFKEAKSKFGENKEFEGVCKEALESCNNPQPIYDIILIDEAQDFPASFLQLCFEMLPPPKRLVYAYDELQNLNSQSLPNPEVLFGKDTNGNPNVKFLAHEPGKPQQDIILEKCYRNSAPILVTAHALGFGIYKDPNPKTGTGLVQMFDRKELWLDVGYKVDEGELKEGCNVVLSRTEESSPSFLASHSNIEDLIEFIKFSSREEQAKWVANQIKINLTEDELRSDDVIVINTDPLTTRKEVGPIREILFNNNINTHVAGVDSSPDVFFDEVEDSVVFTGIYRAKGNEAGMVYIINAQDCYTSSYNLSIIRNRLFTAITRSKAWVRVLGIGEGMDKLIEEYQLIKSNHFHLNFSYPTSEMRETLNIINREMTNEELHKLKKGQVELKNLVRNLESGQVLIEDLEKEQVDKLKELLFSINKNNHESK